VAVNQSSQFQADIVRYLDHEVLRLAQRQLVAYQFAEKVKLPKGRGTTWTATRFNRLPLPAFPLSEGVPPVGENMTISQVTGTAIQWGDKVTMTKVAEITIEHPLMAQATRLLGYQVAELMERNLFNNLVSGVQVNYVNSRGARASLVAGDVLDTTTINRTYVNLSALGAPLMSGESGTDVKRSIDRGAREATNPNPVTHEHYAAIIHPFVQNDLRQNPTIVNAWSYSDVNKLYVNEVGYWSGIHFVQSNMLPSWTGIANTGINPVAGSAGSLATGTYYVILTGSDTQNQYESQIYQVTGSASVIGPTGSVAITIPNTPGYTYTAYLGTSTTPQQIALSSAGPLTGPAAGNATQMAPNQTVILTGLGIQAVPPPAPATGVTVYPTFIFGEDAFAVIELEGLQWTRLTEADKSDPLNQQNIVGWSAFLGTVIKNQQFFARIESSASTTGAWT
jgi:N4-gp56 family major capsid protein